MRRRLEQTWYVGRTRRLVPETIGIDIDLRELMLDLDPGWLDDSWLADVTPATGRTAAIST